MVDIATLLFFTQLKNSNLKSTIESIFSRRRVRFTKEMGGSIDLHLHFLKQIA
jgi:hypothetical protein